MSNKSESSSSTESMDEPPPQENRGNGHFFTLFSSLEAVGLSGIPWRPKAGYQYLYQLTPEEIPKTPKERKRQNWTTDGYRWKNNGRQVFCGDGKVVYYAGVIGPDVVDDEKKIRTSQITNEFTRRAFTHPQFPGKVLVVYEGDEKIAAQFKHMNSKKKAASSRDYVRRFPQCQNDLKASAKTGKKPNYVFRSTLADAPTDLLRHMREVPRNVTHVSNAHKSVRREESVSHDTLWSLISLMHDVDMAACVDKVIIAQDDLIVFGYDEELKNILVDLISRKELPAVQLEYDTKFKMGKFYVSVLSFTQTEFEERPIFACFYMIHERRTNLDHDFFFRLLLHVMPDSFLSGNGYYIVTDEEKAIVQAIRKFLPATDFYRCRNHVYQDVKRHVPAAAKGKIKDTQQHYINEVRNMLNLRSKEEYNQRYIELDDPDGEWDPTFFAYFKKNIHPDIDRLGRWTHAKYQMEEMTTNQAESLNALMDRFTEGKQMPIDVAALCMYRLLNSFSVQIERGRYKVGENWTLLEECEDLYDMEHDRPQVRQRRNPIQIVDDAKNSYEETKKMLSPEENQRITESTKLSYYDRVLEPLREGKVELDCKRRIFIVDGQTQQYFVRLFPNESCSCTTPTSQYPCRHILSAKFAIGMMDCSKKKKNVNELRRKNQAKRRGCKGPTNLKSKRLKNKKKEENGAVDPDEYDPSDDMISSDHSENGSFNSNKKKSPIKHTRSQKKTPMTKRTKKKPKPTEPNVGDSICEKSLASLNGSDQQHSPKGSTRSPSQHPEDVVKNPEPEFVTSSPKVSNENENPIFGEKTNNNGICRSPCGKKALPKDQEPTVHYRKTWITSAIEEDASLDSLVLSPISLGVSPLESSLTEKTKEMYLQTGMEWVDESPPKKRKTMPPPKRAQKQLFPEDENKKRKVTGRNRLKLQTKPTLPHQPISKSDGFDYAVDSEEENDQVEILLATTLAESGTIVDQLSNEWAVEADMSYIRRGNELRDRDLNCAMSCMRMKYRFVDGLRNIQWGASIEYRPTNRTPWIQILHTGTRHYILVARGFGPDDDTKKDVLVYDSSVHAGEGHVNSKTLLCIAQLTNCQEPEDSFKIRFMRCQQQKDGVSCGVFAFGFALILLAGLDQESTTWNPSEVHFDIDKLRSHLIECLLARDILPFPNDLFSSPRPNKFWRSFCRPQTVEVRCHCRLPEVDNDSTLIPQRFRSWIRCNQCKKRYHKHCENVSETAKYTVVPYVCSKCTDPNPSTVPLDLRIK